MRAKYLYKLITHFLVLLSSPPFLYSPWQMNYAAPAKLFIYYLSIDFRGMPNLIRRQSHTNTHLSTHIHRPTLAHTYTRTRVFVLFLFAAFFLSICDLFSQPQIWLWFTADWKCKQCCRTISIRLAVLKYFSYFIAVGYSHLSLFEKFTYASASSYARTFSVTAARPFKYTIAKRTEKHSPIVLRYQKFSILLYVSYNFIYYPIREINWFLCSIMHLTSCPSFNVVKIALQQLPFITSLSSEWPYNVKYSEHCI